MSSLFSHDMMARERVSSQRVSLGLTRGATVALHTNTSARLESVLYSEGIVPLRRLSLRFLPTHDRTANERAIADQHGRLNFVLLGRYDDARAGLDVLIIGVDARAAVACNRTHM